MTAYFMAPRVAMGPGALEELARLGAHRAAVVIDPAVAPASSTARLLEEVGAGGAAVERFVVADPEPTLEAAGALGSALRAFGPDWIVGVGGGRLLDLAKAGWVLAVRPEIDLASSTPLQPLELRPSVRFAAVPTTSGSGSDASWSAFVRSADGRPIEIASRELVPDWTLLDARLAMSLPPVRVADGGAEALAHALEATCSAWANPFADAVAREALVGVLAALPAAVKRPDDVEARSRLHHAASLAGLAASNAQLGAAHALALALGPTSRVPYGRLLGVLLPYVAEFNYPSARDRLEALAPILGGRAGSDRSAVAERLRALFGGAGIPRTLSAAGVPEELRRDGRTELVRRARSLSATAANPRVPSDEEYGRLLDAAFDGRPVTF